MSDKRDEEHMKRAICLARLSREHGNQPFGAVLVGPGDDRLLEAENTEATERDCTGHAEMNIIRLASPRYDREDLARCTLFASMEPCAMCAGAIHWAHIGRVVFALGAASLRQYLGTNPETTRH